MSFINMSISKLEAFGKGLLAFGSKNKTAIMTGSGIALGWVGVYLFWKESRDADKVIEVREAELNKNIVAVDEDGNPTGEEPVKLSKKEKALIYGERCLPAILCGVGSTFLSLYSHKLNIDEITKYALLAKFYQDKNDGLEKQILKEKDGDKKLAELKRNAHEEKYPIEDLKHDIDNVKGEGRTLFVDTLTGGRWKGDVMDMTMRITEFNSYMKELWAKKMKRVMGDAFYVSDNPYPEDENIYVSEELETFLDMIGESDYVPKGKIANLVEFRQYAGGDLLRPAAILNYKEFMDPDTGVPKMCYIDYEDFLAATSELQERYP